MQQQPTFTVLN